MIKEWDWNKANWPIQIDPIDCGCTECLTGEYVPLNKATEAMIDRMIAYEIGDATALSEYDFDEFMRKHFGWQ